MKWMKKGEQVAGVLRSLIESGEWEGHLPGYRKLEERLKVNRLAIEQAIEQLVTEGMIAPAEPGKRRVILKAGQRKKSQDEKTLLIFGPHALHEFSPQQRAILTGVFPLAEREGWKVTYESFDFSFPRKSVNHLEQLMRDFRPTRLILMIPNVSLAQWAAKAEIPCFAVGGEIRSVLDQIDGVLIALSQMVCDAGSLLRNLGHHRILIPMRPGKVELRNSVIEASRQSWARDFPLIELESMLLEQGEWLPDVMKGFWPKAFARLKPTAVIVKETHEYLSLIGYCHRKGIRIPEDLSVIQLSSDNTSVWIDPAPDRFEHPVEKICHYVHEWLKRPVKKPQGITTLPAQYLSGNTLAKANKG